MDAKNHYFIAVPLSAEIRDYIEEAKLQLMVDLPFKTWVHRDDFHITLSFLGFVEQGKLSQLVDKLKPIIGNKERFPLKLSKLGLFGQQDKPRILWLGIEESPSLQVLQKDVRIACEEVGFDLEKRKYNPHITLARRWASSERLPALDHLFEKKEKNINWKVDEVVLYETQPLETPKYKSVYRFPLQ